MKFIAVSEVLCFIRLASLLLGSPPGWAASVEVAGDKTLKTIEILMPGAQPKVADIYLCSAVKVDSPLYVIASQAKATKGAVHHIVLYGCKVPGSAEKVWPCGNQLEQVSPTCQGKGSILYAWAWGVPESRLPDGVGVKVGGDSSIDWIVLQIHYANVDSFLPPVNGRDNSGVILTATEKRQPKRAGIYLMQSYGEIAPHSTTYAETACYFNEPIEIHPFIYGIHTHTIGKVVSAYRIRNGEWTEIGRKIPQHSQSVYNVTQSGLTVKSGDFLAARCTFVNDGNETISIGMMTEHEMCKFYLVYYVDGERLVENNECDTLGPPTWNWSMLPELHSENAPLDASIVPGTTELLKSTQEFTKNAKEAVGSKVSSHGI